MTDLEKRAIAALQNVAMPEEGWYTRRAAVLYLKLTLSPDARLLCSEAGDLWYLVWRFRRQIKDMQLVNHANELVNKVRSLPFPTGDQEVVNA